MSYKVEMILADGGFVLLEELFDDPADADRAGYEALENGIYEDAVDYKVDWDDFE